MPSSENARLAVLIDADNTSPKHAEALLEEVAKYGVPTVKRAYGDWTDKHLTGWLRELPKYAVQPMLQIANTTGKNSTDSALIIDAMDLLYSGNVDAFALVSSDSDFTSLAIRLRGAGRTVYGLGLRKTPESLRQAVDRFIYLEDLHDSPETVGAPGSAAAEVDDPDPDGEVVEPRRIPDLRRLLERAVNATADDDGWAQLSSVRNQITRVEPSFSMKDYGFSKMADLVRAQEYLEVVQPDAGQVRVRLRARPAGRRTAAKKTAKATASTTPEPRAAVKKAEPKVEAEPQAEPQAEPAAEPKAEPTKATTTVTRTVRKRTTAKKAAPKD